ncbi:MAG: YciI family protein [Alphaproteobacteria bacterium]|nr:YciI family protein [Alphaproteobacteria bacterium]
MAYAMLIYETEEALASRSDEAKREAYWSAWGAYHQALVEAGVITGGSSLEPGHTGTTLPLRDGDRQVQDGPYADTKEQLGGYMIFEVPDLDTALDWAARCPAAEYGAVEIRPIHKME